MLLQNVCPGLQTGLTQKMYVLSAWMGARVKGSLKVRAREQPADLCWQTVFPCSTWSVTWTGAPRGLLAVDAALCLLITDSFLYTGSMSNCSSSFSWSPPDLCSITDLQPYPQVYWWSPAPDSGQREEIWELTLEMSPFRHLTCFLKTSNRHTCLLLALFRWFITSIGSVFHVCLLLWMVLFIRRDVPFTAF